MRFSATQSSSPPAVAPGRGSRVLVAVACAIVAAIGLLSSFEHLHDAGARIVRRLPFGLAPRGQSKSNSSSFPAPVEAIAAAKPAADPFYRNFIPTRAAAPWVPKPGIRSEQSPKYYLSDKDWATCPVAAGEPGFKRLCNVEGPCPGPPPAIRDYDDLPTRTATGEGVHQLIQRSLRAAWGPDPPQIDLYFRAGCGAVAEMAYLLPTIELFWPDFLGEIIIALDAGNHHTLGHFLPTRWNMTTHSYRFVYEDLPCLPARVFNQVSYLNLDMHSNAEYIVTIDSDCAFHSPVTPDLLFDNQTKLLLPRSTQFQAGFWDPGVEFFTGPGTFDSHTMVTQPVSFARETFAAYREWMRTKPGGECYFDSVARCVATFDFGRFCWMCQLGTFMQITGQTFEKYNMVNLDDTRSNPIYLRLAIHTTWEMDPRAPTYGPTSFLLVRDGLCRVLGPEILPSCAGISQEFVDRASFSYAGFGWAHQDPARIESYVMHFREAERKSRGA